MKKLLILSIPLFLLIFSGCYSCQTWSDVWGAGPVSPGGEHKFFFDKDCRPLEKAAKPAPASTCGPSIAASSYPCAGSCEIIRLSKALPEEIAINAPFKYSIKVDNVTGMTVDDVVVTETVPSNLNVENASPAATKNGRKVIWKLGSFEPGQSKRIMVSGIASGGDCIQTCATVVYKTEACASVKIVKPDLKLVETTTSEVSLCEPIFVEYVVTNPGTGTAENIKIVNNLPTGLQTVDGKEQLIFNAGSLGAGQSRQFSATLKAQKPGGYAIRTTAISANGLKSESRSSVTVRQSVLAITKTGPKKLYIGRPVSYEITVTNIGNITAENLMVEDIIPSGTRYAFASNDGQLKGDRVVWDLDCLKPGDSRKLDLKLVPQQAGTITNTATATALCAEAVTASTTTAITGIPAILLEAIDVDDPIEIGGQTTYVITATNQGSATGTNISIVCTLEDNEQYLSSRGATAGTVSGNTITFAPLKNLPPKTKAIWHVIVKAVKAGDVRFKVTMNTDQITRPVEETEATRLYE